MTTEDFISFAAEVFGVPSCSLSPDTRRGSVPEWDSVMHLRLAMEVEAEYGVRLPFEKLPELDTLKDFFSCLGEVGAC